ncbi:MAG TPA: hypothetical protein PKI14_04450 [Fervidobacterium sp.]|nr:hypothetical protein [Fervidobacterium sp.]
MSDYKNRKDVPYAQYPQMAEVVDADGQTSGFTRVEEYLTPDRIRNEFLFGIPLISQLNNQEMSDETLKNIIHRCYADAELELNVDISPVVRVKKLEYDRTKSTQGWNMLNVGVRAIRSVQEVSLRTTNSTTFHNGTQFTYGIAPQSPEGGILYTLPLEWIDLSMAHKGILSFVPLQTAPSSIIPGGQFGGASAPLLAIFQRLQYIPGFWHVKYEAGFPTNAIPATINSYVGCLVTMRVIQQLLPTIKLSSQSVSHDGSSQSISNASLSTFPQVYTWAQAERVALKDLIKSRFSTKIFMSNI